LILVAQYKMKWSIIIDFTALALGGTTAPPAENLSMLPPPPVTMMEALHFITVLIRPAKSWQD
jgi:hypothetical protein